MKISIVVCYHCGELIHRCLDSIRKSKEIEYEIIVVSDEYRDFGKDVRVIICKELPAQKRNYALNFCNGKLIAFLDDDTEVTPLTLYWMMMELEFVDMTYAKLLNMEDRVTLDHNGAYLGFGGFLVENIPLKIMSPRDRFYTFNSILAGKSACCMIKRSVFNRVGGFDRDFGMFGEETDLSWRIWLAGGIVSMCPDTHCYHAFNTSLKDTKLYYNLHTIHYHGCKNYPTMLIKNLSLGNLILTLPIHILIWIMAYVSMKLKGKHLEAHYIIEGLKYICTNRRYLMDKRALVQNSRVISDKDLFPYIAQKTKPLYYINRFKEYITQGREERAK